MEGFSTKFVSSFEIELKVNTRLKKKVESLINENLLSKNDSPQKFFSIKRIKKQVVN